MLLRTRLQNEVKSTLEVGDQIFHVLDTDGGTDHVLGDTSVLLLLRRHIRVSHGGRMLDEGLDTTKRHGKLEVVKVVQDGEGLLLATLDEEGDVGTRAAVLLLEDADLLLAHGAAARIVDSLDCRVGEEEVDDLLGVLSLSAHTKLESGERTGEQPSRVRVGDGTKDGTHHLDLANELLAASGDTSDDIRVTADELGGRVDDDVCAPLVRLAEDGTTESVIHDEEAVVLLCNTRSSLEVGHGDGGVGRGLDVDDLALATSGVDGSLDLSLRASSVERMRGDLEGRKDGTHEELGATIDGIREGDVVARTKEGEAGGGDSTHTTAHDSSSLSTRIPDGDLALKDLRVGVCNTAVNQSGNLTLIGLPQSVSDLESSLTFFGVPKDECRGTEDGRNDSTFRPFRDVTTAKNFSLGMRRAHYFFSN